MKEYIDLLKDVLENGKEKIDRTQVGTISIFGSQTRYNLEEGFPLLTTKKMHLKSIIHELLWFISGDTNIKYLVDNDVRIWNEWPYENYKKSKYYKNETMDEFINKIKLDSKFSKKWGDLGPVYGKMWRDFCGVDQLNKLIKDLKTNKESRRLIISAWNPKAVEKSLLPPCHCFMQFYVNEGKLSCQLYQRSADIFLGVPFNIASYALFTMMIAKCTDLVPSEFIHTIGDAHIYLNHIKQVQEQIKRNPYPLPKMIIKTDNKNIEKFKYEDFELIDYKYYPLIKGKVAV